MGYKDNTCWWNHCYWLLTNGLRIQWGKDSGSNRVVNFSLSFTQTPIIVCVPHAGESYSPGYFSFGYNITNSSFTAYKAGASIDWIAIGY